MCGIVGFYAPSHFSTLSQDLGAARDAMAHRGPDDSGQFEDGVNGVGLGHRRLSIIDLSQAGAQPI